MVDVNNAIMQGAQLFLQAQGIKDRREQELWMRRLQGSQMQTQGLEQQMLIQKIAEQQEASGKRRVYETALKGAFGPRPIGGGAFTERDIPPPGQESQWFMQKAGPIMMEHDPGGFLKLAQGLQDKTITEPEILMKGGPEAERYIAGKQRLQVPKVPPSAGNAVDLAIKRKFGSEYLSNPQFAVIADKWLATPEGIAAVKQAAIEMTPPTYNFQVTSEGIVPGISRGPGAGTLGQPTGFKKPISAEQLAKVGDLNAVLQNIEQTKALYGYGTPTEHQEWVGPAAGRLGGFQAKYLGTASPEQVKFYAYIKDMMDALLRARSGAQINEQEYKRLVAFLPDPNLPPTTFKAKLDRFQEATQIVMNQKLTAFEQGGFGVGGLKSPTPSSPSTPKSGITRGDGWKITPIP